MSAQSRIADPPITGGRPLLVVSALVAALAVAAPTCDEPSSSNSKTSEIVPEKPEEKQSLVTFLTSQSEVTFRVEVADDAEERRVGLMDRQEMAVDAGMIFVFPTESIQSFWMQNTYIPLDMIFISANKEVVGVVHDAEPLTLTSRRVDIPSLYVVEVNAGLAARFDIQSGTHVAFENVPDTDI